MTVEIDDEPEVIAALRRCKYFAECTEAELRRLAEGCAIRTLRPHETVTERGAFPSHFYILLSGRIAIWNAADNHDSIISLTSDVPGAILYIENTVADIPYLGTLRAFHSTARLLEVPREALRWLVNAYPGMGVELATDMARRVHVFTEQFADLGLLDVRRRLAKYLAYQVDPGQMVVSLGMSQQELAVRLAASRQSVHGALAALVRRRAIVPLARGRYRVLDLAYLRMLAHLPDGALETELRLDLDGF